MGIPAKLKNFNVFADGDNWMGLVGEVQLPKLAKKVEQWRGGGMLSEVDIEMGLEKMEAELKLGGMVVKALRMGRDRRARVRPPWRTRRSGGRRLRTAQP